MQVMNMKSSLAVILLVLGFVQSSWQVPLLEADDSSRYKNYIKTNTTDLTAGFQHFSTFVFKCIEREKLINLTELIFVI